ncbi:MAG: NAD kinase [Betaproteobacteria bacterium]|jgi:NAD+ kinase|nr:NAD kinase [Rhodocyclaceae bacterium]MCA3136217.1 NAD kinase [Rhodocyclaceae bacterium]MCA3142864.1 NAD kinase [Rhodocyclaceae bacterium]MCA3144976.1 NAD kinase [Rhodocyclaceae bacterium]MCE2896587.1 NAD kinase [Betaproteobacteria bacterium]
MSSPFRHVALIGKHRSPEAAVPLSELAAWLEARGVEVSIDPITAEHVQGNRRAVLELAEIGRRADLAIVIGGDGTMLNIARTLAPFDVPLVGVNMGRLGFLTDVSAETLFDTLGAMLDGAHVVEPRMLLAASVRRGDLPLMDMAAFNEVSVNKGAHGGLIELEVRIDGQFVYNLRADGLIVSSPTGSTAYALSAGGPIVHPALSVLSLVPVCPHTLSNRPIVVPGGARVEIFMLRAYGARVQFDSHSHAELEAGDCICVASSTHAVRLLHPLGHDYYHMLREKLHWSETPGG